MKRTIHNAEAVGWLKERGVIEHASFITSLPDFSEFPNFTIPQWKEWFVGAAKAVCDSCPIDGVVIFYQRDSKFEGTWIDKGFLCQKAAEAAGMEQLWHKVVARGGVGHATFGRPGFSHLLCFSRSVRAEIPKSTADILPEAGDTTWTRGMGLKACEVACKFVLEQTQTRIVVDPFCGHGTVLAVANRMGLEGIGVELGRRRADKAKTLQVSEEGRLE